MDENNKQLRAIAIRQVNIARPTEAQKRKATAAIKTVGQIETSKLFEQSDLLHVEAVLVTEGINDNDDAFTHDNLQRAISSPILKPMNWQHKDDDIVGAMYSVEARDLQGNTLEEIGDEPIELVVQGVVWKQLPHLQSKAQEIIRRIESGDLFVSMECWFDDYEYGIYTSKGELYDIIPRNTQTAHLERSLKVRGGSGMFNGMRIGRALSGINFGGVAFVDKPANKRSFILDSFTFDPISSENVGASNDGLDQQAVTNNVVSDKIISTEVEMNDLNRAAASGPGEEEIETALDRVLARREQKQDAQRAQAELSDLRTKAAEFEQLLKDKDATIAYLRNAIDKAFNSAKAGATDNTPAEIAKIDQALEVEGDGAGEAVWKAKIDWIEASRSAAAKAAKANASEQLIQENEALKAELGEIKNEFRQASIEHLFSDVLGMEDSKVETFVKAGLAQQTDEDFDNWFEEKKIFAQEILSARAKYDGEDKKDKMKKMMEMKKKKDAEAGLLVPEDRDTPIEDHGAVLRSRLGRVPNDMSREPRSKLSASVADIVDMFEEVEEPNLAGASYDNDDAEGGPSTNMRSLVEAMMMSKKDKKGKDKDKMDKEDK